MTSLYWQTSNKKITLQQSIQDCLGYLPNAIGLTYSPRKCYLIRLKDEKIELPPIEKQNEKKLEIDSIFEARIFTPQVELRWLNERNGEGKAVLISENALNLSWNQPENLKPIATQTQKYILWGKSKSDQHTEGWTQLVSNRIGSLYVPCSDIKDRVCLRTCEYFSEDDYGNIAVIEERLIKLEPVL